MIICTTIIIPYILKMRIKVDFLRGGTKILGWEWLFVIKWRLIHRDEEIIMGAMLDYAL